MGVIVPTIGLFFIPVVFSLLTKNYYFLFLLLISWIPVLFYYRIMFSSFKRYL